MITIAAPKKEDKASEPRRQLIKALSNRDPNSIGEALSGLENALKGEKKQQPSDSKLIEIARARSHPGTIDEGEIKGSPCLFKIILYNYEHFMLSTDLEFS